MMEENTRKLLRREGNTLGGTLLIYMAIMNASVIVLTAVATLMQMLGLLVSGSSELELNDELINRVMEQAVEASNWGYLLAVAMGLVMLLLWKKPSYFRQIIFVQGKKMTGRDFLLITVIFLVGQQLFQWWYLLLEWISNLLGVSPDAILESGNVDTHSVPMYLYACLLGPVAEEILFRGLVLRSLQPYGKKFAIVISSLLFGLFHGNLMQAPFAFVVGLVMGYVAMEYHIGWAVALHLINNLVFADLLPRILSFLPQGADDLILTVFLLVCTLAAVVILILRWREIRDYWKENPTEKGTYSAFFRAPAMIVFLILTVPIMLMALPLLSLLQ